jgi:hypothetical protein
MEQTGIDRNRRDQTGSDRNRSDQISHIRISSIKKQTGIDRNI